MKKFHGIILSYIWQTVTDANLPNNLTEEEREAWISEVDLWVPHFPFLTGIIYSIDSSRANGRPSTCATRNGTDGCPSGTSPTPKTTLAIVTWAGEVAQVGAPGWMPNVFPIVIMYSRLIQVIIFLLCIWSLLVLAVYRSLLIVYYVLVWNTMLGSIETGPRAEDNSEVSLCNLSASSTYMKNQVADYSAQRDALQGHSLFDFFTDTYEGRVTVTSKSDSSSSTKRRKHGCPRHACIPFQSHHPCHWTRLRIIRSEKHNSLPNFIGQYFPPNNDDEQHDFYCASMLTLFKPWQNLAHNLKLDSQSWSDAFNDLTSSLPLWQQNMINNIQYFHECENSAHNWQYPVTDLEGEGDASFSSYSTKEESFFDMTTWNWWWRRGSTAFHDKRGTTWMASSWDSQRSSYISLWSQWSNASAFFQPGSSESHTNRSHQSLELAINIRCWWTSRRQFGASCCSVGIWCLAQSLIIITHFRKCLFHT